MIVVEAGADEFPSLQHAEAGGVLRITTRTEIVTLLTTCYFQDECLYNLIAAINPFDFRRVVILHDPRARRSSMRTVGTEIHR